MKTIIKYVTMIIYLLIYAKFYKKNEYIYLNKEKTNIQCRANLVAHIITIDDKDLFIEIISCKNAATFYLKSSYAQENFNFYLCKSIFQFLKECDAHKI